MGTSEVRVAVGVEVLNVVKRDLIKPLRQEYGS